MKRTLVTIIVVTLIGFTFCDKKPSAPELENPYDPQYAAGDDIPPTAAFVFSSQDSFMYKFDASASYESEDSSFQILYRWDFENDGRWNVDWTPQATTHYVYRTSGTKSVLLEVKGIQSLIGRTQAAVKAKVPAYMNTMVYIPAGVFLMGYEYFFGSHDPRPVHQVNLDAFWMSKYEITNQQFAEFLNSYGREYDDNSYYMIYPDPWGIRKNGSTWEPQPGYANHPVVGVTWYGAAQYAKWQGTRLPTEAEWEYAARGTGDKKSWLISGCVSGYDCDGYAWFANNSGGRTHTVGELHPNSFGLYDMSGNVYEWCQDWFGLYPAASVINPRGPAKGTERVYRGGAYNSMSDIIPDRFAMIPLYFTNTIGFRVVKSAL